MIDRRRLLGLCVPPLLLCLLDFTVTLVGQSPAYWAGNYSMVNEASPTFHDLLRIHPAAYVAGGLFWAASFVGLILLLPEILALILSIAIVFGHTAGAASWILWQFRFSYQFCNALFLFSAISLGLGIRFGLRKQHQDDAGFPKPSLPAAIRWTLVVILIMIPIYLFLVPKKTEDAQERRPRIQYANLVFGPAGRVRVAVCLYDEAISLSHFLKDKPSGRFERFKVRADLKDVTIADPDGKTVYVVTSVAGKAVELDVPTKLVVNADVKNAEGSSKGKQSYEIEMAADEASAPTVRIQANSR